MAEWKLYVWKDVLCNYTCGMAFAIARNKAEAIKTLSKDLYISEEFMQKKPRIHQLLGLRKKTPFGYYVYGGG